MSEQGLGFDVLRNVLAVIFEVALPRLFLRLAPHVHVHDVVGLSKDG